MTDHSIHTSPIESIYVTGKRKGEYPQKNYYHRNKEDRKKYQREYSARPEVKERLREYYADPIIKARRKAWQEAYNQKPEVKARRRAYYLQKKEEGYYS